MTETFEIRMREEFRLLQKLQNNANMKGVISISYLPRTGGSKFVPITANPCGLYPTRFKVKYTMPMYVSANKLQKDWSGTITFDVTEEALLGEGALGVQIEGGSFPAGSVPFNRHVSAGWICTGNAWEVSKQGYGIWYFVIAIGCIFNLDPAWQNPGSHLNGEAAAFFDNVRKQATNDIKWPYNLREKGFVINKTVPTTVKKTFTIKPTFTIKK